MNWKIKSIDLEICKRYFSASAEELAKNNAKIITVKEKLTAPCRLSLKDLEPGDKAILLNYEHYNVNSPYKSIGPVFVGLNSQQVSLKNNSLPEIILPERRFSIRSYDENFMMIFAEIVLGKDVHNYISEHLKNTKIKYMQVHFAAPGCWIFDIVKC